MKNKKPLKITDKTSFNFNIDEVKKELNIKGFERLNFEYKETLEELWLTFFIE